LLKVNKIQREAKEYSYKQKMRNQQVKRTGRIKTVHAAVDVNLLIYTYITYLRYAISPLITYSSPNNHPMLIHYQEGYCS
jgi:hypothetical protein